MAGPFDFLHIKGRTKGSSNELSFSVLDARNDAGKKGVKPAKMPSAPKPSQGSYHGVTGTSTLSTAPEVSRRKKDRRNQSARLWVVAAVAVVALVGTAVYVGVNHHHEQENFSGNFNSLIEDFVKIDERILKVDALMNDPLNSAYIEQEAEVAEDFPSLHKDLNALQVEARKMGMGAFGADAAALSAVESSAAARKDMLDIAEGSFAVSKQVNGLANQAEEAWVEVLEADAKAREALDASNAAGTREEMERARTLTAEARELFNEALVSFKAIGNQTPGDVFGPEKAFIQRKIDALDAALATDDALLAGDRSEASAQNDAYNEADQEAATLANGLTVSPKDQVKAAFVVESDRWIERYGEARAAAATSDATIRTYL